MIMTVMEMEMEGGMVTEKRMKTRSGTMVKTTFSITLRLSKRKVCVTDVMYMFRVW
jgi:hypothetical protein